MNAQIAVQLYTLRSETAIDFKGTLEKVAAIGYEGVEFAGYGNLSSTEMKVLLNRLNLKSAGSHVGIDQLRNNLSAEIDYNLEIGNRYIVCPYDKFETMAELKVQTDFFNEVGAACKAQGLQFCYHNHNHEFQEIEGVPGLDLLFQETDKDLVKAEVDTYWVQFAGRDPVKFLKKYQQRVSLIHLKDMDNTEKHGFTEIGNGIMDIKNITTAVSVEWVIVEQDVCQKPCLESVEISYKNLKKMG